VTRVSRIARAPLFWLALLYLLTGLVYAWVTPVLEKSDENDHYGYILYLREHRALPPISAAHSSTNWMRESMQPPLYYVVATVLTRWLPDDPDLYSLLALNPYISASVPGYRNDNRNLFLHPPYMTPLVLSLRLVSLLFGLGTMIASYFLASQLFPRRSMAPLAVAALVGFQPKFLYVATAINNGVAVVFLGTLALTVLIYRLRKGEMAHFAVILGGLLGLASITKLSGLVFFPLTGLALLFIHRRSWRALFRDGVIVLVVALLVGGWWYARNALLYGDPTFLGASFSIYGRTRPLGERIGYDLFSIERSFWANLSRTFVSNIWLDDVLIWWGRTSAAFFLLSVLFNRRLARSDAPTIIILLSWPVTFLAIFVLYWARQMPCPYGRYMFPAIAPLFALFVWGWHYGLWQRWRHLALVLVLVAVVGIGILVPFVSLYPLFHPSRERGAEQVEHPVGNVYVDAETGEQIARLVGYNLIEPYALTGAYFPLELCWEPLGQTDAPYAVLVQLLDLSQLDTHDSPAVRGRRETYPGLGNRPTDRWALHRTFCDEVLIWIDPAAPAPLGAAIEVGFLDPESGDRLWAVDAQGDPISLAFVGSAPILSPDNLPATELPATANHVLDDAIGLERAQFSAVSANSITLTLTWQSLRPVQYDATMFIHLRGADGSVLAQVDRQPLDGRFPTSYWIPGQIITDVINLPLAFAAYEGPLVLHLGMYTWPSLERLPVMDASGVIQPDNVIVVDAP